MTPLEPTLQLGIQTLRDLGARFALVGGLAVSSWAEPRTTRDIDLAVAVESDSHAEAALTGPMVQEVKEHLPVHVEGADPENMTG